MQKNKAENDFLPYDVKSSLRICTSMKIAIREIQVYPAAFPHEYEDVLHGLKNEMQGSHCKIFGEYEFDGFRYQCRFSISPVGYEYLRNKYLGAY